KSKSVFYQNAAAAFLIKKKQKNQGLIIDFLAAESS
ncbi:MAG: hypothetical protein ACJA1N_000910, partial [Saprospiraceae bacterium]